MKASGPFAPMFKEALQKGAFVKHCPCSPGAVPCGYYNLNLQTGCPFDCSYCILQAYLEDKSRTEFYTNWADLEAELQKFMAGNKEIRIGTGELSDSLAYENLYPTAARILELFMRFPDTIFEFKTKAVAIRTLLDVKEVPANIVVSWSLNPPRLRSCSPRPWSGACRLWQPSRIKAIKSASISTRSSSFRIGKNITVNSFAAWLRLFVRSAWPGGAWVPCALPRP
jgi:DNA repair photolyase